MKKKLNMMLATAVIALASTAPAAYAKPAGVETVSIGESVPANSSGKEVEARIRELYGKKLTALSSGQKYQLRGELKQIQQRINGPGGGLYISASAIILILLILIIVL